MVLWICYKRKRTLSHKHVSIYRYTDMHLKFALNYFVGGKWRSVLAHLGCHHRVPQTKWLLNNRSSLLTVLEAATPKVKAPAGPVVPLFNVSSQGRRGKGINPIHDGSTFMTSTPPKAPLQTPPILMGVRI